MNKFLEEASKRAGSKPRKTVGGTAGVMGIEIPEDSEQYAEAAKESFETVLDILAVFPQTASLEWADNALEGINPNLAEAYREMVARARKRSPTATTITDLFAPDVLSVVFPAAKATKIEKLQSLIKKFDYVPTESAGAAIAKGMGKGAASGTITDILMQAGTEGGEYSPLQTLGATGLSGVAGGVGGTFSQYSKMRAKTTGVEDIIDAFDVKTPKGTQREYMVNMLQRLADETNLFQSGKAKFNIETGRFEPISGGRGVGLSNQELFKRVEELKKLKHKEVQNLLSQESQMAFSQLEGTPFEQQFGDIGISYDQTVSSQLGLFTKADFAEDIEDVINSIPTKSDLQEKAMRRKLNYQLKQVGMDLEGDEANFEQLDQLKKNLYKLGKWSGEAKVGSEADLFNKFAKVVKNKIEDKLASSPQLKLANRDYGDLSIISDALDRKMKKGESGSVRAGQFSGSPQYAIATFVEGFRDRFVKPISQISEKMQVPYRPKTTEGSSTIDIMKDIMGRGIHDIKQQAPIVPFRRAVPVMEKEKESASIPQPRNPELFSAQMNLPTQLVSMRIPRTSQGIMENKQLVLAKIAQEMPESFSHVQTMMESEVDVNDALPVLIEMLPHMFEKDRYNRINNILPENMKPLAMEEIRKDEYLSPTEKISRLDLMNRTGEYYA